MRFCAQVFGRSGLSPGFHFCESASDQWFSSLTFCPYMLASVLGGRMV